MCLIYSKQESHLDLICKEIIKLLISHDRVHVQIVAQKILLFLRRGEKDIDLW